MYLYGQCRNPLNALQINQTFYKEQSKALVYFFLVNFTLRLETEVSEVKKTLVPFAQSDAMRRDAP